jgi:RIO-like serine/threonine protein kinase
MKQQQKNDIFKRAIEYVAGLYKESKTKLNLTENENILVAMAFECWAVPHPVHIETFWVIGDILEDLEIKRWSNKRISKWLLSIITESREIVPIGKLKDLTHTIK